MKDDSRQRRDAERRVENATVDRAHEDLPRAVEALMRADPRPEALLSGLENLYNQGDLNLEDLNLADWLLAGGRKTFSPATGAGASGPGRGLSREVRRPMEEAFGVDLSSIRVHDDGEGALVAGGLDARAATSGRDVFVARSEDAGDTALMAHEVTHAIAGTGAFALDGRRGEPSPDRRTERRVESDRRRRREPGGRDRSRRSGGDLESDWAGRAILYRYLTGGGTWRIQDDPRWTAYMKRSSMLSGQIRGEIEAISRDLQRTRVCSSQEGFRIIGTADVARRFHAEVENGEGIIGYQYLHGSNSDVGDFELAGTAALSMEGDRLQIAFDVNHIWHDMIDPNPQYSTDTIKSIFAEIITLGRAEAYDIHIGWRSSYTVEVGPDGRVRGRGWPFAAR